MLPTIHSRRNACDVVTPPVPSGSIVLADLIGDVLVRLEARGKDRMAAMLCVLGPARFDPVGR